MIRNGRLHQCALRQRLLGNLKGVAVARLAPAKPAVRQRLRRVIDGFNQRPCLQGQRVYSLRRPELGPFFDVLKLVLVRSVQLHPIHAKHDQENRPTDENRSWDRTQRPQERITTNTEQVG